MKSMFFTAAGKLLPKFLYFKGHFCVCVWKGFKNFLQVSSQTSWSMFCMDFFVTKRCFLLTRAVCKFSFCYILQICLEFLRLFKAP